MNVNSNIYDVIVVGAGASGLTACSYLTKKGYDVLLCEKNQNVGGLVNSFNYNGFILDGGIRAFENSGIIFPMLKQLGIELDFVKNPIKIGIEDDVIEIKSKESLFDYQKLLIKYYPDNKKDIEMIVQEIKKVMSYMDVLYGIDNPLFLDSYQDTKYLFNTLLPWFFKFQKNIKKALKLNQPVNDYLAKFTSNKSLIDIITQHFFKNTPTFFALSYFSLYLDYSYPRGGSGILANNLKEYIEKHQGHILTNTEIVSINTLNKEVKSKDGSSFFYKKLIWACNLKTLYNSFEPVDHQMQESIYKNKQLINRSNGSDSIFTVYLGINIDKSYFQNRCGSHLFYSPSSLGISNLSSNLFKNSKIKQDLIEEITNYLKYTTYEISCPVLRDENLAPIGQTGLIISTLMDYQIVKEIKDNNWYTEFKELCINVIIETLDRTIFKDFKSKIIFSFASTPLTIENMTGNLEGAITGWAFNKQMPSQTRLNRITKSIITPINDIYQVGQWTFSPSGLPMCILTGKLAADKVSKSLKR